VRSRIQIELWLLWYTVISILFWGNFHKDPKHWKKSVLLHDKVSKLTNRRHNYIIIIVTIILRHELGLDRPVSASSSGGNWKETSGGLFILYRPCRTFVLTGIGCFWIWKASKEMEVEQRLISLCQNKYWNYDVWKGRIVWTTVENKMKPGTPTEVGAKFSSI
jgi:hypothetical protein